MKIIERKGDIARNEQYLLFPQCFSLYRINKLPAILRLREIVDSNRASDLRCARTNDARFHKMAHDFSR